MRALTASGLLRRARQLDKERYAALVALVVLTVVSSFLSEYFLQWQNLLNILRQVSYTGIIALGMTFVIISGGIDLSVGSMAAFVGSLGILALNGLAGGSQGLAVAAAVAVALVSGLGCGFANGILITKGRIAPFIVTLGTMALFRSLSLYMADAGEFRSASSLFGDLGSAGLVRVPLPVLVMLALAAALAFVLTRTRYGRYVRAVGSNARVARYSAIDVDRTRLIAYTLTGLLVGISVDPHRHALQLGGHLHGGHQLRAGRHRRGDHRRHLHGGRARDDLGHRHRRGHPGRHQQHAQHGRHLHLPAGHGEGAGHHRRGLHPAPAAVVGRAPGVPARGQQQVKWRPPPGGARDRRTKMRKLLGVVLVAALAALGGSASAQQKIKIGVTMPTADHGWMGGANWWAKKAMDDWKAKDPNVDFIFKTSGDVTKQVADIEDMLVQGVNGLVVFPFESAPVTPVVEKAHEKGVYVVVLDCGVTKPVYDVYLSNDDESYARQGMDYVCKALGGKGNVVLIEGLPSVINDLRTRTAKEVAAKYPGIKILDSQPGNWNKEKATAVMENYLAKYKSNRRRLHRRRRHAGGRAPGLQGVRPQGPQDRVRRRRQEGDRQADHGRRSADQGRRHLPARRGRDRRVRRRWSACAGGCTRASTRRSSRFG